MSLYLQDARRVKGDVEQLLIRPIAAAVSDGSDRVTVTQEQLKKQLRKLWTLVKVMRTARRSLRSNAAMYRYLKELFPYADFRDVPKPQTKFGKGLSITLMIGGTVVSDDSMDDGDNEDGNGNGNGSKSSAKQEFVAGDGEG